MDDEIKEIEKYKWIRSEQAHRDTGQEAIVEWITNYAKAFRENWEREHEVKDGNCCSGCAG